MSCDRVVVGAGVIGLAIAEQLADPGLVVLEAHPSFGMETSSRNSEVIHSGIHYPKDSLKTKFCLSGREKLIAFAQAHEIPYRLCGKATVAVSPEEQAYLADLAAHADALGVAFEHWSATRLKQEEPEIEALSALFFPGSGIVDSHALMAVLERKAQEKGALLAYRHRVQAVEKCRAGWRLRVQTPSGLLEVEARQVVNAAGLAAAYLSNLARRNRKYAHRFCRGRYLQMSGASPFRHLVYPVPQKDGLGIHITLDLGGQARLGPDTDWCLSQAIEDLPAQYDCDWDALIPAFAEAVRRYYPRLSSSTLSPGLIGIRPKLFVNGMAHPDFVLESSENWVDCLGMESPGLTASLALAEEAANFCTTAK